MSLPPPIADLLDSAAKRHGISRELARAVAWVESRGNPRATSSAGAMGVMQLMPRTAKGLGVNDPYDPATNIDAGVRMLASLMKKMGSLDRALAAYNWGIGNVRRGGRWPASVHGYVAKVRTRMGHTPKRRAPAPPRPTEQRPHPCCPPKPQERRTSPGVVLLFTLAVTIGIAAAMTEWVAYKGKGAA